MMTWDINRLITITSNEISCIKKILLISSVARGDAMGHWLTPSQNCYALDIMKFLSLIYKKKKKKFQSKMSRCNSQTKFLATPLLPKTINSTSISSIQEPPGCVYQSNLCGFDTTSIQNTGDRVRTHDLSIVSCFRYRLFFCIFH